MTTSPTPPHDLRSNDDAGIAGTLHTPDPAAVERLKRLMAQQQPRPRHAEAGKRVYSGDRIAANIQRAAEAVTARRTFVLTDDELADVEQRRANGETWKAIAADYGVSHTTLMAAVARYKAAQRKARP